MTQELDGVHIARERVALEAKARTGFLDLGKLGLTALPEELFHLQHLQHLNLGYGIENERGWFNATSTIVPNQIEADLERLGELPNLKTLSLAGTRLNSLIHMAKLSSLRSLNLNCSGTQVSDLSALSSLKALQMLDCSRTEVKYLSPLGGLTALQALDCCETPVSDLTPLAGLTALQALNCRAAPVRDLSPLADLIALQALNCAGTPVNDRRWRVSPHCNRWIAP
jgi:internalin A